MSGEPEPLHNDNDNGDPDHERTLDVDESSSGRNEAVQQGQAADEPDEAEALAGMLRKLLAATPQPAPQSQDVGLYQLVEAFTALRHDVKLQAKAGRTLGEQTESAISALQSSLERFDRLSQQVESERAQWRQQQQLARPLARALVQLHEAVERIGGELSRARQRAVEQTAAQLAEALWQQLFENQPRWRRWLLGGRERRRLAMACNDQAARTVGAFFDSVIEGYQLMQNRLNDALGEQGIERIQCLGEQADPYTMRVVDTVAATEDRPGTIIEELRPGYLWGEQVLQTAEVRAAARPQEPQ